MSDLSWFDANCFLGRWGDAQPGAPEDACGLRRTLAYLGIDEALVYHASAVDYDSAYGNELLAKELDGHANLHACWVVMPHYTDEMPQPKELARQMAARGVRAARLYPKRIGPLRSYVYGELLGALADRSFPLLLDFELGHWGSHLEAIDWDGLDWLLGAFPDMPVILVRAGQAVDRLLLPFMDRHHNLYIETSYYLGTGALERLSDRFGAERLIFGTGMPRYAPGPAITLVSYSGLDEEAKRLVAGGNLRRLLRVAGS